MASADQCFDVVIIGAGAGCMNRNRVPADAWQDHEVMSGCRQVAKYLAYALAYAGLPTAFIGMMLTDSTGSYLNRSLNS